MAIMVSSLREVIPKISYSSAYEFEDIICDVSGARRVNLIPKASLLERLTGRRRAPTSEACELFFAHVMSPAQLHLLNDQGDWRDHPRKAIWVEELWPPMLKYRKLLNNLKNFDYIFTMNQDAIKPLEDLIERPCSVLTPGIDALAFCPWPNAPDRCIDVLAMGRRRNEIHRSLYQHATADNRFFYDFDTVAFGTLLEGHRQHRMKLASTIKRTKFFIADRAKLNAPQQTAGSHVFGPRFFEGAAGGAILTGVAPDTDLFRNHFDWPDAYLPLPEGSDPLPIMNAFAADEERVAAARVSNVLNMLERHDWVYRWEFVLDRVGMPAPPGISVRKSALMERADMIRANELGPVSSGHLGWTEEAQR